MHQLSTICFTLVIVSVLVQSTNGKSKLSVYHSLILNTRLLIFEMVLLAWGITNQQIVDLAQAAHACLTERKLNCPLVPTEHHILYFCSLK